MTLKVATLTPPTSFPILVPLLLLLLLFAFKLFPQLAEECVSAFSTKLLIIHFTKPR